VVARDGIDMADLIYKGDALVAVQCSTNPFADIYQLPAIDATEIIHGYWIKEFAGNGWNDIWNYTCSVCSKKFRDFYSANYCPECGAKMDIKGEVNG